MARGDTPGTVKTKRETAEEERRRRAAQRQVRTVGDPVLRERAPEVTRFDGDLQRLADRMIGIMRDAPGIGLAATQLGVLERMLVYDVGDDGPHVLVNPEIIERSDETEVHDEGCLSVGGGVTVPVERAVAVRVRALDVHGSPLEYTVEGIESRVVQHELDHLDGILILDRTSRRERARALRELRDAELLW